jgi:hypothetical protein
MAMNRHHQPHSPDFFAVLLFLVAIGFGVTLAVQLATGVSDQVVETEMVRQLPNAG